jgi:antirestriction protein ArdC
MKKSKKSVYEIITSKIIGIIESSGELPWSKKWADMPTPYNYKSGRAYSGLNMMLCRSMFDDPRFLTFKNIKELGGKLKKGSNGVPIIFWMWTFYNEDNKRVKEHESWVKKIPFLRYYTAFNASDVEGIEFEEIKTTEGLTEHTTSEEWIKNLSVNIKHKPGGAFYSPARDIVNMPELKMFEDEASYYSTLFHEVGHWTGHKTRMDRFESGTYFGNEKYSKEELVAEMFSCFARNKFGIETEDTKMNSAAYIKGWLKALKNDPKMIISASSKATKAFEFCESKAVAVS